MNILKAVAKFIGWLSGSLAGIGAILTVFGYLITIANLRLLGLDVLILNYDAQYYLRRGGNFFFYVVGLMSEKVLLPLLAITLVLSVLCLLLYVFISKTFLQKYLRSLGIKAVDIKSKYLSNLRAFIFVFLVILFLFQLSPGLDLFINPLKVSNLLYDVMEMDNTISKNSIEYYILHGETPELKFHFCKILLFVVVAGLLLLVAWRVTSPWKLRVVLVSPFVIIFALYVLFLPMAYGVLILTAEFAPIEISSKNQMVSNQSRAFYLLNKTEKEFILWDSTSKKLFWIPTQEVKEAEILPSEPIIKRPHKQKHQEEP